MTNQICDCCGKSLTKQVYVSHEEALVICSRCHAWAYRSIKFVRMTLAAFIEMLGE
jgi:hypothetical protein